MVLYPHRSYKIMARSRKRIKSTYVPPPKKIPRIEEDVDKLDSLNFKWRANDRYVDYDHNEWGWSKVKIKEFFRKILRCLQDYETMTWAEIKCKPHCHPVEVSEISLEAQKIIDGSYCGTDIFQINTDGLCRLFGVKDRQTFYLIWHDPNHSVSPMKN
jgi:hypothetical protein